MSLAAAAVTAGIIGPATGAAITAAAPTLGSIATAASLGSAAIGGLGAIGQGRAAAASAGYNAKVAAQNAQIATQNSQFAGAAGEQEVGAAGAQTKARVAATEANQTGSGIDINTGSAVDVRESEAKLGMLNALTIRSNVAKQAYGFQIGAASDTGQAALDRSQQQSATTGGYLNAGATVLGGIGSAAKYTSFLNKGGLGSIVDNGLDSSGYAPGEGN